MHLDFIFTRTWNIEWYAARIIVAHQKLQGASSRSSSIVTGQKSQIMSKYTASPKVWGAAYHIPASKAAEVREYLDIREINGYSMQYTPFHVSATTSEPSQKEDSFSCLVYIGLPDNPQFLGPQDQQALAEHILKSTGPSGENREYLYLLDEALTGLSDESRDEHIHDLARRCRELEQAHGGDPGITVRDGVPGTLKRVGSTQEQEEVEREEETQ
ncbi:hypothetical protein B0A49_12733 [Cryomyces minteri]|uniref:glutathione-specific gamma-glutamylcyclotransferase n=1 Tax=Cryomyces minteri TaxID=331657 RepID=A0A4U0VLD7_9PEZI|nr:hypothetical protein B0A49_12733 [Cryomyces minteri]